MNIRNSAIALMTVLCAAAIGCSHYSVKTAPAKGNEDAVKSKLKVYEFYFGDMNGQTVDYNRSLLEKSIKNSGDIPADKRLALIADLNRNMTYEPYRFFHFTINHREPWGFGKDDFKFSMEDASGNLIQAVAVPLSYHISGSSGSFNVHRWIIKTDNPLKKTTAKEPVKVSFKLFGDYELTYYITPDE